MSAVRGLIERLVELYIVLVIVRGVGGAAVDLTEQVRRLDQLITQLAAYIDYATALIEVVARFAPLIEYNLKTMLRLADVEPREDRIVMSSVGSLGVHEDRITYSSVQSLTTREDTQTIDMNAQVVIDVYSTA